MNDLPPLPPEIAKLMPPDPSPRIGSEIGIVLADWPLYRLYKYEGDLWARGNPGVRLSFPRTIRLHCPDEDCLKMQLWEAHSGPFDGAGSTTVDAIKIVSFRCRNCRRSIVRYVLLFDVDTERGEITKVGQWPPLARELDSVVVAKWENAEPSSLSGRCYVSERK